MTPPNTHRLRELLAAATPGPWTVAGGDVMAEHRAGPPYDGVVCETGIAGAVAYTENTYSGDADFIAEARNALGPLLDRLDALEAVAKAAREACNMRGVGGLCEESAKACRVMDEMTAAVAALDGATR